MAQSRVHDEISGPLEVAPILLTSRLHEALRLALVEVDASQIDSVPGYFNHPENNFAKYALENDQDVTDWSERSPDRYQYALEAIGSFMRQASFSKEIILAFDFFMYSYSFHMSGHPNTLFQPTVGRSKIDSPARLSVKIWIAIAIEAYLIDGISNRTAASRFIADCLIRDGKSAIDLQSLISSRQSRSSRKSFAGVIEDWNRMSRAGKIPLHFANLLFQKHGDILLALKGQKVALNSKLKLGDLMVANALDQLDFWRLTNKNTVESLRQSYMKRSDRKWSEQDF
jgi:hypothetical protein